MADQSRQEFQKKIAYLRDGIVEAVPRVARHVEDTNQASYIQAGIEEGMSEVAAVFGITPTYIEVTMDNIRIASGGQGKLEEFWRMRNPGIDGDVNPEKMLQESKKGGWEFGDNLKSMDDVTKTALLDSLIVIETMRQVLKKNSRIATPDVKLVAKIREGMRETRAQAQPEVKTEALGATKYDGLDFGPVIGEDKS